MAQRIKLDLEPDDRITFDRAVDIPTPDGKGLKITFTFKHRDRQALAELFDGYITKARATTEQRTEQRADAAPLLADDTRTAIDNDVATLIDVATGWNVDAPFDSDNLRKLCTKFAGAAMAIVSDYRVSLTQGRLGN